MNSTLKSKLENLLASAGTDEQELAFKIKQFLNDNEWQLQPYNDAQPIETLALESINQIINGSFSEPTFSTGFTALDKELGGFSLGEYIVLGGRPSMGKTQLLINLALHISTQNPVLYCTFDLSAHILTNRIISSYSNIPIDKILQHNLSEQEQSTLQSAQQGLKQHSIFINEKYNNSLTSFRVYCEDQISKHGIKVIIVDYIQMLSTNRYRNNREQEISQISRSLKNLAKDLNVCLIASSQLSRAVETRGSNKIPQLSDLRDSGALEQDADKVLLIYRPEYYGLMYDEKGNNTAGTAAIFVAKNRTGRLGEVMLTRDAHFTNFRDFEGYKTNFNFARSRFNDLNDFDDDIF